MQNTDLGTTIIGAVTAVATGATPVVEMAKGEWNTPNIVQLIAAIGIALLGFFTNKGGTQNG